METGYDETNRFLLISSDSISSTPLPRLSQPASLDARSRAFRLIALLARQSSIALCNRSAVRRARGTGFGAEP